MDVKAAALHRRRCRFIVLIEYACMTAVVIDRDVLVVVLEDHARMRGITAALQGSESTARKVIVVIFAKTAVVFIRSVTVLLVVPYGTVL